VVGALILQAYINVTGDTNLSEAPDFQQGLKSILSVLLNDRFEVFPTLLVPDGAFMIDWRLDVYGHPLDMMF